MTRALPLPPVAGVLREVAVLGLLADVLFLVVAMALGGVEGDAGRAAGALVALVLFGNRGEGFVHRFGHRQSPLLTRKRSTCRRRSRKHNCHSGMVRRTRP